MMIVNRHLMFSLMKINHSLFINKKFRKKYFPDNFFDSMFTSKRIQDPLQYDLFVPSTKTVSKGKHSAKYHQAARFFRDVL